MRARKLFLAICACLSLVLFVGAVAAQPLGPADAKKTEMEKIAHVQLGAAGQHPLAPVALAPGKPAPPTVNPRSPLVVLYDQNDNVSTYGASTQNFETAYDVYDDVAADDFLISGSGWTVTTVVFPGFYNGGVAPTTVNVRFYADTPGTPSTVICDYPAVAAVESPSGTFTMTLSPGCVLGPGVHWVSVQANLDYATGGQFYWYQRTVQSNTGAQWENPNGGFGSCPTWGPLTTCLTSTYPDLAFTLSGSINSCNTDPDCNDGNLCTTDACVAGACVNTPLTCPDDGLFCTLDVCNPVNGQCYMPNLCNDNDGCTADSCDEVNDVCVHSNNCLQFCSNGAVSIPSSGASTPYPSTITVAGAGAIASVTSVQLNCITHTYPDDLDFLLVGPLGQNALIMSDVGGGYDLVCVNLNLTDSATTALPDSAQITSGTYLPTNIGTGDTFPAPAPTPSGGSALSVFNNLNPNGAWNLYVVDDASGDSGTMTNWCLNIFVASCTGDADCNDNNPCTDDACVDTQCTHGFNNNSCNDGNACTSQEYCSAGACGNGVPKNCNDNNACTSDSCNTSTGDCINTNITCDDSNPCTDNLCDTQGGCFYPPNDNLPCTDNNLCTADACVNGACVSTPSVDCSNGPLCTVGTCIPSTGQCQYTATPGLQCQDGDWCTVGDVCVCQGGTGLSEYFDNVTPPALPTGWTGQIIVSQTGDLNWETVTTAADTAPNSAWGEEPSHVSDKALVSPTFTAVAGSQLKFAHRRGWEGTSYCWDGGLLEIKIGAADWQDIITAGGVFVSGAYNGTIYSGYGNPLGGRPGWCFSSTSFENVTITMPPAANGQIVQLRWREGSDDSVSNLGWWIDTIVLPICDIGCIGAPRICTALDQCHDPGKCDSYAQECTNPAKPDGTTCVDGNDCTGPDQCVNGSCVGGPPVGAPEVNNSVLVLGGGGGGGAVITWTDAPGPFNVYRGARSGAWFYNHTCFESGTAGPSTDVNVPAPGQLYYYLVSRKNQCGESVVGRDWQGAADPNTSPCP